MTKFRHIAQVFNNLGQRIILTIRHLSISFKSSSVSVLLLAIRKTISGHQRRRKRQRFAIATSHCAAAGIAGIKLRPFQLTTRICTVVLLVINLLQQPQSFMGTANAATTLSTPLSTLGSNIVDATGESVLLRGVNWFGMETSLHVPHGLWTRDYKDMLAQIKSLGYNIIRLPYSVQALRSSNISGVDFSIGSNNELYGKTPLQVMDLLVKEADKQGLLILLDSHRLNDQEIPELWYGNGFTEADWIGTWTMLADHYKTSANVIGADLKNEPHGQASWGTGNQASDWRLAAERAGSAIQAVNPNWLIVVEGVESNVPGQQLAGHWQGGNLEGVRKYPVRLSIPNKLVYSPHEYGAGVYNQPWFSDPTFPDNLPDRWETGFNYIATHSIAPILIGEFGGRQVDGSSKEGIWQQKLVNFIGQKGLSFTYWDWNPDSGDTGGILLDDWRSVDALKQQLLSKLLSGNATPTPTPTPTPITPPTPIPTPTPTPKPIPTPSPGAPALRAEAVIKSDWEQGFCVDLHITNQGNASTKNWQLTFQLNQATITSTWNGSFVAQGTTYRVTPPDWGRVLPPNQTADSVGYCAKKQGSNYKPTQLSATSLDYS